MSDPAGHRPVQVHAFPNRELGIVWDDEHESYFPGHDLRCSCGCAKCVDETTGQKVLENDRVPKDVHVTEVLPVGNYGLSVRWSDGHETGIYTFARLRQLCPCCR